MNNCMNCGGRCVHNYCDWQCQIEHARKLGGKEIRPNGLPITCIRGYDNALLEHEAADHPDYKFPVKAEFCPPGDCNVKYDEDEPWRESHALIYTDGSVVMTMYECCYAIWSLRNGKNIGGDLWKHAPYWRLTVESLVKIREFAGEKYRP